MELLYLYIEEYRGIFHKQEINFSNNYQVKFQNGNLEIEKNKDVIKNYYGDNISNITLFLGKNGVGKTSLLNLLGMKFKDRTKGCSSSDSIGEYFLVYHLEEEKYVIEMSSPSFLKGEFKIKNLSDNEYRPEKYPIGMVVVKENTEFKCISIDLPREEKRMKYFYTRISNGNNEIKMQKINREDNNAYLFEREYEFNKRKSDISYQYYVKLLNQKNIDLTDKNMSIILEHYVENRYSVNDELTTRIDEILEKLGYIDIYTMKTQERMFGKQSQNIENKDLKEIFITNLYCQIIMYYFINKVQKIQRNSKAASEIKKRIIEEQEKLLVDENHKNQKKIKYLAELILLQIQESREDRNEEYIEEQTVIREFMEALEKLDERYFEIFNEKYVRVKINCNVKESDNGVIDLLKFYDVCMNNPDGIFEENHFRKWISLIEPNLSEGYMIFSNIVSNVISVLEECEDTEVPILLLDEPDSSLHPELARQFIFYLVKAINSCKVENVQIILTSHSPFIVTDILPEHVYNLKNVGESCEIENDKNTYATNIYSLLMDSFMLSNTFGEYSYIKIREIMKELESTVSEERMKEMQQIVKRIGEPVLRKKLECMLEKKVHKRKQNLINQIKQLDNKEIEKIERLLENDLHRTNS